MFRRWRICCVEGRTRSQRQGGGCRSSGRALAETSDAAIIPRGSDEGFLCRQLGDLTKHWRGVGLHNHCWNGVRCYHRMLKSRRSKDDGIALFTNDPQRWKEFVLPLVVTPGSGYHPVSARSETFTDHMEISDTLRLTKPRFKAYMKFWEQWDSDEASSDFENLTERQSEPLEDSRGNRMVEVMDNPRCRATSGSRSAHVNTTCEGGESTEAGSSRDTRSARSRTPPPRSNPPRPILNMPGSSTDPPTTLGQQHDSAVEDLRDGPTGSGSARKQTFAEFMQLKKGLAAQCDSTIASTLMRRSVAPRVEAAMSKLGETEKKDILGDPVATVNEIRHATDKMHKLKHDIDDARPGAIDDLRTKMVEIKSSTEQRTSDREEAY